MHTPSRNRVKIIATILVSTAGIALIAFVIMIGVQVYSNTQTETYLLETEKELDNIAQQIEAIEVQIDSLATNTAEREPEATVPVTTEPEAALPVKTGPEVPSSATTETVATLPLTALTPQPEEIRRRRRGGGRGGSVQPTTAPTAMPQINSETGPGICRRHPKLQDTLIAKLRIPSCQLITADELFRVTELPSLTFRSSLQPGDFAGLVNLQELRIRLEAGANLHADTFHGLERLEFLSLDMRSDDPSHSSQGTIVPGEFRGLSNIKVLELRHQKDTDEPSSIPAFEHIETLEQLDIRITDHVFLPNENDFSNLPILTSLSISINPQGPKFKSQYRLSQELFQNNVKLEQVKIEIWEADGTVRVERNTFLHLDQLQSLSLAIAGDTEIYLSPNSPLLKDIINGNQSPSGYTIIPPGAK